MSSAKNDNESSSQEKIGKRSWIIFIIFFVIAIGFIVYFFPEIKKEFKLLKKVNPYWLAIAILAQIATYILTALVYHTLLKPFKLQRTPALGELIKASIVSQFFNQTVPSAGISGNTFFFNFFSKFKISVSNIVSLILTELLIFYAAMEAVILVLLATCLFFYQSPVVFKTVLAIGAAVYIVFGFAMAFSGRKDIQQHIYKKASKLKFIKKIFERINKRLGDHPVPGNEMPLSALVKKNKNSTLKVFLFHILVVAADAFTLYALFIGLGVTISTLDVLLALICTRIISILPFLPGSLVLYESSMSFLFAKAGIAFATAVIVTLLYRLLSFWLPMPFGLLFYRRWIKEKQSNKAV